MLKKFIQTSVLYNVIEKVVLHQPGTKVLLDGLM
jgi:hypothetical protein